MRKIWELTGGVHPPENKSQSTHQNIGEIPLPDEIVLPLNQHIGTAAMPVVELGERVLTGQLIADAQGLVSAPVHASTSGTISAIEDRPIPHASGLTAPCIVIAVDHQDQWIEREPIADYHTLDKNELVAKIRQSGLAGMGGAGFPTAVKLTPRADQPIHTLILNGTECEPYITADDMLMRERADDIVAGTKLLAHILGNPKNIIIGIEDNKPEAIAAVKKAAKDANIEVATFATKYPSGGEKQLIQILTGKEVPSGGIPARLGIVMQNVGTAVAAHRAIKYGEPLIQRVTTVVGESLQTQRNINVRLGTPIRHVLQQHGWDQNTCARLIIGGPMMGYAMDNADVPVVKTTNCILVPSHQELPAPDPAQACIRCGMCAEACPASLLPQQLFWFSQAEELDKLKSHNLFDCIECGACSYVCPSNIPLVQYYRASKSTITRIDSDKHKSDRARERFEFRKQRIAKAEAEKEAKRLARRQAAEQAKRLQAEKPKATDTAPPAEEDQEKQRDKLLRTVASAQSNLARAQSKYDEAKTGADTQSDDSSRLEALLARKKQTQQKLNEAEAKLAAFNSGDSRESADAAARVQNKLALSPKEQLEKTIATLEKRVASAEVKAKEASESGAATAEALQMGVSKLREKLLVKQSELAPLTEQKQTPIEAKTQNAADLAIAKAQAKAEALATMSESEKAEAHIASLKTRLAKAQERLAKAEAENSEHVAAFENSVAKLEQKLAEALGPVNTH